MARDELRSRLRAGVVAAAAVIGCFAEPVGPLPPAETDPAPEPVFLVRDGLRYRAVFLVRHEHTLSVEVTIHNPGREERVLRFGDTCVALLRAYWPRGGLAWDMAEGKAGCRDRIVEVALAADQARSFRVGVGSMSILLGRPEGTYRITAYLRPLDASEIEMDLGPVPLTRPVDR